MVGPIDFEWDVPMNGFRWIDGRLLHSDWTIDTKVQRFLVPVDSYLGKFPDGRTAGIRGQLGTPPHPRPLDEDTGLFLNFAAIGDDEGAALTFANNHGMLGEFRWIMPANFTGKISKRVKDACGPLAPLFQMGGRAIPLLELGATVGDAAATWRAESSEMRYFTDTWRAAKVGDKRGIPADLASRSNSVEGVRLITGSTSAAGTHMDFPAYWSAYGKDCGGALYHIAQAIEKRVATGLTPTLPFREGWASQRFCFQPRTLLHAMWLQFALAFAETRKYHSCDVCGKLFELSADAGFRINRTLCSNACKVKSYRQRKKKARQLRAAGRTPRQIAKELGSDVATVKGWLG